MGQSSRFTNSNCKSLLFWSNHVRNSLIDKASKFQDATFQDELMTHLIGTGHHSNSKYVLCGEFNQDFNKKSTITKELTKHSETWA